MWRKKRWCTSRQLESLIGHLHHAAKVAWPGRTFVRRMFDLLCCFRSRDHPIHLNGEFHKDIQWWSHSVVSWHGVRFWLFLGMSASTDVEVTSDATGSLGFGAYFRNEWFSGAWGPSQSNQSIAYKELFPVVVASHVWGPRWHRCHVLFRSDNEAVVHILIHRKFRALCSFCATYCLRQLDIVLPLLLFIYLAFITQLLMLSPVSIGRSFGVWRPRLYRTQLQFLISCGIF